MVSHHVGRLQTTEHINLPKTAQTRTAAIWSLENKEVLCHAPSLLIEMFENGETLDIWELPIFLKKGGVSSM